MTKKLESLFDLPTEVDESDDINSTPPSETKNSEMVTLEAMDNLEKIDQALPAIKGLEAADSEMDEIAEMAIGSYKDLMDLGMNVEARLASEILSSASNFLGHAITAKNAKINKKLKMIELQLRKAKLDQERKKTNEEENTGEGKLLDRNELLAEILKQNKKD